MALATSLIYPVENLVASDMVGTIGSTAAELTVQDVSRFPNAPNWAVIWNKTQNPGGPPTGDPAVTKVEIVEYGGIDLANNKLTLLTRGQQGTTAQSHNDPDTTYRVAFAFTKGAVEQIHNALFFTLTGGFAKSQDPLHVNVFSDGISVSDALNKAVMCENNDDLHIAFRRPKNKIAGLAFNEGAQGDGARLEHITDGTDSRFEFYLNQTLAATLNHDGTHADLSLSATKTLKVEKADDGLGVIDTLNRLVHLENDDSAYIVFRTPINKARGIAFNEGISGGSSRFEHIDTGSDPHFDWYLNNSLALTLVDESDPTLDVKGIAKVTRGDDGLAVTDSLTKLVTLEDSGSCYIAFRTPNAFARGIAFNEGTFGASSRFESSNTGSVPQFDWYLNNSLALTLVDNSGVSLEVQGDLDAQGGHRQSVDPWLANDIAQSQTNVALERNSVGSAVDAYYPARAGSVTALQVTLSTAPTAGQLSVEVFINDVATGLSVSFASGTQAVQTQAKDTDGFSAEDEIQLKYTSDSTLTPATIDIQALLEIET